MKTLNMKKIAIFMLVVMTLLFTSTITAFATTVDTTIVEEANSETTDNSSALGTTKADMEGVSLKPYYLVRPEYFAYVTVTSRNGEKISLAYNNSEDTYICSSSYIVFRVKDQVKLLPGYLNILLSRDEFNRYARFNSWGSARETFDWEEMCDVRIPIPDIDVQQYITNIFIVYQLRKEINEQLKAQIRDICPILIKGSVEEREAE
jgi:type I restriction enzyme S subunit